MYEYKETYLYNYDEDHEEAVKETIAKIKEAHDLEMKAYHDGKKRYVQWCETKRERKKKWEEAADRECGAFVGQKKKNLEADYQNKMNDNRKNVEQTEQEKQLEETNRAQCSFFEFRKKHTAKVAIRNLCEKLRVLEQERTTCTEEHNAALENLAKEKTRKYNQLVQNAEKRFLSDFPNPGLPIEPKPLPEIQRINVYNDDPVTSEGWKFWILAELAHHDCTFDDLLRRFPDFISVGNLVNPISELCRQELVMPAKSSDGFSLGRAHVRHPDHMDYLREKIVRNQLGLPY